MPWRDQVQNVADEPAELVKVVEVPVAELVNRSLRSNLSLSR
jgi:hypothetical protein